MKTISKFVLILIITIGCVVESSAQDSTATISGRIEMPQIRKEKRSFRGRMYRNRLAKKNKSKEENETLKSPYIDVIVVLHPLDFKVEAKPLENARIIQRNAVFIPRVIPVTRNTVVEFVNYDKFYHNVFSVTPGAKFNLGRRPTGTIVKHKIERPGEIKLFCDIHAQMNATILSLDTPYFNRVQPGGSYKIENIPGGNYLVQVYHPDLPDTEEYISITAGRNMVKDFILSR
jgi:plastocyanin